MGLSSESVIDYVKELLNGKIIVPSIQREYVWARTDVRDLLDSLYRGYPVGSLLLWKTELEVPFKPAAVVQARHSVFKPLYLLDGQQRLTSLAWVYRPSSRVNGAALDVRFDLRDEQFVNPSAVQRKDPMLIPVTAVIQDDAQLMPILISAGIEPSDPGFQVYFERLQKLNNIRNYKVAVMTHQSDDYEEIADIFARVNKGGRRLTKGDLVYSAIAARWSEGLDTINAFHAELARNSYPLDREAVLRLMSLLANKGAMHLNLLHKSLDGQALKTAWTETETALRYAVDFLRSTCGIPRSAVLTSPNIVIVPALLLHTRQNILDAGEDLLLRRWVYTAMAFSHYSLQVETKLDAEARLVRTDRGEPLFAELIRRACGPRSVDSPIQPRDLEKKYASHAFFNLLYIAALHNGAKDWVTNVGICDQPMASDAKIEFHHVFPQARVKKTYPRDEWNSLANLAFISSQTNKAIAAKAPAEYMPKIASDRLAEQWIPQEPASWQLTAFPQFLSQRREMLVAVLNNLLGLPKFVGVQAVRDEDETPDDEADLYAGPDVDED